LHDSIKKLPHQHSRAALICAGAVSVSAEGGGLEAVHAGRPGERESVTYNFDADRWYENQKGLLVARR